MDTLVTVENRHIFFALQVKDNIIVWVYIDLKNLEVLFGDFLRSSPN